MDGDKLVTAILHAARKEPASAEERRQALARVGLIAQSYCGSTSLIETVFGSLPDDVLKHDVDQRLASGSNGGTH